MSSSTPLQYADSTPGEDGCSGGSGSRIKLASRPVATLGEVAERKLRGLCAGLGLSARADRAVALFEELASPWSSWAVTHQAAWPTDITDDGTPFEFSVAFGKGTPELRMLVEAQKAPLTSTSSWTAALELNERLARRPGVSLGRFQRISDLFAPAGRARTRFCLWHAASVSGQGASSYKVYLNPHVRGPHHSARLVEQALARLDMQEASRFVGQKLALGGRSDVLYLSLDLADTAEARVKLYLAHEHAGIDDIEAQLEGSRYHQSGSAQRFIGQLTGSNGPFAARPILTCLAFDGVETIPTATLHVPVRCYVGSDAETLARLGSVLDRDDAVRLADALERMADRPLHVGRGLITYASRKDGPDGPCVTTYLAPEAYSISTARWSHAPSEASREPRQSTMRPAALPASANGRTMADVETALEHERAALAGHPFLRRLEQGALLPEIRAMARDLCFFVMAFQDVLRLARAHATDPELAPVLRIHEQEDHGHDRWFLRDLERLGVGCDVRWLFSPEHALVRDVAYSLVAEVLRARDDRVRLSVVLSLEAVGAEFFGRVIAALERLGAAEGLLYFARSHEAVESSHQLFCDQDQDQDHWSSVAVPDDLMPEVLGTIERAFGSMTRLATHLEGVMRAADDRPTGAGALFPAELVTVA